MYNTISWKLHVIINYKIYITISCTNIQEVLLYNVTKFKAGITMALGKRIKEIRKNLNLTSAELAIKLDIPVRTIGSYEREEAQPGPKFLSALIEKCHINVNWLLSGKGNMFISKKMELDINYITKIQERFNLTEEEVKGLIDILESDASRDMVLKFIQIKRGNKDALESLLCNLQGIKAIYG